MASVAPTVAEILQVLNSSVTANQPQDTFEIALVLGGTVSAGAYTAGFLDMLIEALDAWYLARQENQDVPKHNIRLRVATGASGGAVCAAILARALSFGFPHVSPTSGEADQSHNPFYHTWVERLDAAGFFDTSDLSDGRTLTSLLNGDLINKATKEAADWSGGALPGNWKQRPYVDNPFRLIVTLANLTGVLYQIDFGSGGKQSYVNHADYARFACDVVSGGSANPPATRPDEFLVWQDGRAPAVNWLTLSSFARASGAFPFAFPTSGLRRPHQHYDYRVAVFPGDEGKSLILPLRPDWQGADLSEQYSFQSIDGGTFNNEPIELARTFLAGVTGRNPRDRKEANRAVLLIDPLPTGARPRADRFDSLLKLAGTTLGSLIDQSRYSTSDLMLMADPDVFSRFLAAPRRGTVSGEKALATAGLSAFIGFFEKEFRRHDFMLGRANCRTFLAEEFALAPSNPVFTSNWTAGQKKKFGASAGAGFLPIIPLVGRAAEPDGPMPWPKGKLSAHQVRNRMRGRLETIIEKVADDAIDFPLSDLVIRALRGAVAGKILDPIEKQAELELADWGL